MEAAKVAAFQQLKIFEISNFLSDQRKHAIQKSIQSAIAEQERFQGARFE